MAVVELSLSCGAGVDADFVIRLKEGGKIALQSISRVWSRVICMTLAYKTTIKECVVTKHAGVTG